MSKRLKYVMHRKQITDSTVSFAFRHTLAPHKIWTKRY